MTARISRSPVGFVAADPMVPAPGFVPTLNDRAHLRAALQKAAGRAACLLGTQSAGKSMYAQYLLLRATEGMANGWSLAPRFRAALGGIQLAQFRDAATIRLLEEDEAPALASLTRFHRASASKSITVWRPTAESPRSRGMTFFDVPGESSYITQKVPVSEESLVLDLRPVPARQRHVTPVLAELIGACPVVVLFVPVWSLLPQAWLMEHAPAVLGDAFSATSLAVPHHGNWRDDAVQRALRDICAQTILQTQAWKDLLLRHARPGTHLVVVLSQFQKETVTQLFDSFVEDTAMNHADRFATEAALAPFRRLGTRTWAGFDDVYQAARTDGHATPLWSLAAALRAADDVAYRLIHGTRLLSDAVGLSSEVSTALEDLITVGRDTSAAVAAEKGKLRTASVIPLNLFAVRSQAVFDQWTAGTGDVPFDFRGCEDVLWTMLTRLYGPELWTP